MSGRAGGYPENVRARVVHRIAVAAALATASCSLFTDLGALSGGEQPSSTDRDASPVPPEDDGGVIDAGAGDDGARPDAGGDGGRLCDGPPASRFCADFDGVAPADLPIVQDRANVTLTETTSVSAPTSMLVEMSTPASANGQGGLEVDLGQAGPKVRVALDMRVSEHSKDYTESLAIRSVAAEKACEILLALATTSFVLWYGCTADQYLELGAIPFDQWVNVVVTIDAPAGKGTIVLGKTQKDFPVPASFATGNLTVFAGVHYAKENSGPIRLAVDDFVVQ